MKIKRVLLFLALLGATSAYADEAFICYGYGCASSALVHFRDEQLLETGNLFAQSDSAETERKAIALAIGKMQLIAGEQSPIFNDKGGNLEDDDLVGRMDCIDHTHTTGAFLALMAQRGWLRFHEVLEPVSRPYLLIGSHWAARIAEKGSGRGFVVDAWFFDHGHPASLFALEDWMDGAEPDTTIRLAWREKVSDE